MTVWSVDVLPELLEMCFPKGLCYFEQFKLCQIFLKLSADLGYTSFQGMVLTTLSKLFGSLERGKQATQGIQNW